MVWSYIGTKFKKGNLMDKPLIMITGASSGLGASTAKLFSRAGYPLALFSRNLAKMEQLNLNNVKLYAVDVADKNQLDEAIQNVKNQYGFIDCLINNAGIAIDGDFTEISASAREEMVDTNLKGLMNTIELVLPEMQAHKRGTIINISSLSDRRARPNNPVYAATKAAVRSLTGSLRMAYASSGIRFCNIAPAKIHSPMWDEPYDPDYFVSSETFAETLLWIYQQPQSVCIRDLVIAPTNYEP